MHKLIFASTAIVFLILTPAFASGEVYIPDHEYVGFYDHDGVYTRSEEHTSELQSQ